jgi:hypothetical protein
MTKEQILEQVSKYEKGLSNPNIPDSSKNLIKGKIEQLKADLAKMEKNVEVKEEKMQKEEKKVQEDLESMIAKYKKGLSNPNIPESSKETIKKKIADAEKELEKQKKEIKEDKKEAEQEKKEIKEAVKKVEKIAKSKTPSKQPKVKVPQVKEEQREKKQDSRKVKLKKIMTELEQLIEKNKKLSKYKGSGVDLEKDAKRSAKPFGYRFTGKHDYRIPTEQQVKRGLKTGKVYYEGRPERADKFPTGKGTKGVKLAKGGSVLDADRFAKPMGWRWKDSAVEDGIINKASLSHSPSLKMRKQYPDYVYSESRKTKSDKNPSRKYQSLGDGGKLKGYAAILKRREEEALKNTYKGKTAEQIWKDWTPSQRLHFLLDHIGRSKIGDVSNKELAILEYSKLPRLVLEELQLHISRGSYAKGGSLDADRFAKPSGWRWKNSAVEDGIISRASLSHSPSLKMRREYPDYVAFESRPTKSDKKPSRKYQSI